MPNIMMFIDCSDPSLKCLGMMPNIMRILAASRNLSFVFKYDQNKGFE